MKATISEFEQELKPGAGFMAIAFLGIALIFTLLSEARWLPDGNAFIVVAKSAFVAKVSHELRTPLNMVIGLVDVISEAPEVYDEAIPPTLLNDLAIVRRNAEHLASMINDIFDLSQRTRIRQVVLNLVSNAARYTEAGEITVAVESDGGEVVVRVTNTGPGLQPDQAKRIFEPFYRAGVDVWREHPQGVVWV